MINELYSHGFCKDDISKIENYDKAVADTTQTWHLHHRLELTLNGEFAHSKADLIRLKMYYNRPYFELIFMPRSEHVRLHMKGKKFTNEHRKKISVMKKCKNLSDKTRQKISESKKGYQHSSDTRQKMSEAKKAYWQRRKNGVNN